jgi:hypothetical protein
LLAVRLKEELTRVSTQAKGNLQPMSQINEQQALRIGIEAYTYLYPLVPDGT